MTSSDSSATPHDTFRHGYEPRPMGVEDLDAVLALERRAQPHPWSPRLFLDELDNPLARIELLWRGEELAGFACCHYLHGELHILNIATAPELRRQGIASLLLQRAIEQVRPQGLERVLLEVRAGNHAAIALYEKFGFRRDGLRRGYYADGEDALLMSR